MIQPGSEQDWLGIREWYQARGLVPPPDPPRTRPETLPRCPPTFTPDQWADVCDWYWSGWENGWDAGFTAAFEAGYQIAAEAWRQTLPAEYIPRTPFIQHPQLYAHRATYRTPALTPEQIRQQAATSWRLPARTRAA